MKVIIENHSDLSMRFCLEKSSYELVECLRIIQRDNVKFYNVKLQTFQNGILYSYHMFVNKIKTGLTFKFYNL